MNDNSKRNYFYLFFLSILITSAFLILLPDAWKVIESSDFFRYYQPLAQNLLSGKGYVLYGDQFFTYLPPGYPLYLAGVFSIANLLSLPQNLTLLAFQVFLTGISVLVVFHLAQMVTNVKAAAVAALGWGTYPFLLWLNKQPNSEIPFIAVFFIGCAVLFSNIIQTSEKKLPYLLSGILLGLAMLIRPIALFFPLVVILYTLIALPKAASRKRIILSLIFLMGVVAAVLPWEIVAYAKTDEWLFISKNSTYTMQGGLVFALVDKDYKQPISVPSDVERLMQDIRDNQNLTSTGAMFSYLGKEMLHRRVAVAKLFIIKAFRSWYATDRQSYDGLIRLIQIPYMLLMLLGSIIAYRRGGGARDLMVGTWLLTLSNWGMTIMVTSILRYMVPVIGLQFINIAQVPNLFITKKGKVFDTDS